MAEKCFKSWLRKQGSRDDQVGDFARDVSHDPKFPAGMSHKKVLKHLESVGACEGAERSFEKAFAEFKGGK